VREGAQNDMLQWLFNFTEPVLLYTDNSVFFFALYLSPCFVSVILLFTSCFLSCLLCLLIKTFSKCIRCFVHLIGFYVELLSIKISCYMQGGIIYFCVRCKVIVLKNILKENYGW
jgi:hypothetical protein